jgi:hypothetical protein
MVVGQTAQAIVALMNHGDSKKGSLKNLSFALQILGNSMALNL